MLEGVRAEPTFCGKAAMFLRSHSRSPTEYVVNAQVGGEGEASMAPAGRFSARPTAKRPSIDCGCEQPVQASSQEPTQALPTPCLGTRGQRWAAGKVVSQARRQRV